MKFKSLFYLLNLAVSRPDGSPVCQLNVEAITKGMGPVQDLGFTAVMKKRSNTTFSIEFTNAKNLTSYSGILMYVAPKNNESVHYGKFTFERIPTNVQNKWKYVSGDTCSAANIKGASEGTVTHAKPDPVTLDGMFMLELSEEELKIPDLVLKSAIVGTGGRPASTSSAPASAPTTAAPPVGKVVLPAGHPIVGRALVQGHPPLSAKFAEAKIALPQGHPSLDSLAASGATIPSNHPPLSNFYVTSNVNVRKRQAAPASSNAAWQALKDVVITGPAPAPPSNNNTTNATSHAISVGSISMLLISSSVLLSI